MRVPRKLNARSSAIWRRYLYLVPLKRLRLSVEGNTGIDKSSEPQYNVNAEIVNKLLLALEGLELPYNAFAYQEDRNKGEGMRDLCTLHKARAYLVNLDLDSKNTYDNNSIAGESNVGLCIELVGDRFLRQMVRRLVSTAIHESRQFSTTMSKPTDTNQQIYNPLVDICHSGDRNKVQSPFPGEGLCLAGVGFDTVDLSFYRFMPKEQKNELLSEYGLSRSPYDRKTEND